MTEEERNEFKIFTYTLDDGPNNGDTDMICDWIESKKKQWDSEWEKEINNRIEGYARSIISNVEMIRDLETSIRYEEVEDRNSKLVEKAFNETK